MLIIAFHGGGKMNKELNQKSDSQERKRIIKNYMKRKIPYIPFEGVVSLSKGTEIESYNIDTEYKNKLIYSSKSSTHEILEKFHDQKWVKAQPHDEIIKDKSKKFFIKGSEENKNPEQYFNTDSGIKEFLRLIKDKQKGVIYIKGNRGSGKTFTMNYILNLYTEDLQKNNIFWVRATLFKVYEKHEDKLKCNIKDYLSEKLLRICLKYSEYENNICKELREFIENYINKNSKSEKGIYLDEFITKFKEFDSTGEKIIWEKLKDDYDSVDNLKNFEFKIETNLGSYHFLELLIFFITKIKERKLLIILDSMDNIDYLMKENSFNELMKQLEDFIKSVKSKKKLSNVLLVVSGRPETIEHLQPNALRGNNPKPDGIFEIAPIDVKEFLKKRLDYTVEITEKKISDFEKFIENYVSLFYSCIKQKIDIGDINPNNFIQEFYKNSYRDIYDDLIYNFAFIKDYVRNKSKSDINLSTDILEEEVIGKDSINIGGT